jgi:hypothetical protein
MLRHNYAAMGAAWCATKLRRTIDSIENKAHRIGISKSRDCAEPLGPAAIHNARRCTDCHMPTADYRCPECWAKRRATYRDSCDGPTADEMYGVMA